MSEKATPVDEDVEKEALEAATVLQSLAISCSATNLRSCVEERTSKMKPGDEGAEGAIKATSSKRPSSPDKQARQHDLPPTMYW